MHLKMYSTNAQEVEHHDVSHCQEMEFHMVPNFPPTPKLPAVSSFRTCFLPCSGGLKNFPPLGPSKENRAQNRMAKWTTEVHTFHRFRAETTNHHGHSNDKLVNSPELKIPHGIPPVFQFWWVIVWGTSTSRIESKHHIYNFLSWCEIPIGFDRINLTNQRDKNKTNETNGFSWGCMLLIFGRPTYIFRTVNWPCCDKVLSKKKHVFWMFNYFHCWSQEKMGAY